jgi:hypothetical protein
MPLTSIPHTTLAGLTLTIYSNMMIKSGYQTLMIFLKDKHDHIPLDSTKLSILSEDSILGQISMLLFKNIARHVLIAIMLKLLDTNHMVY